jgi:hypothetical protein
VLAAQSEPLLEGEFDEYLQFRRGRLKEEGEVLEDTTRVTVAGFAAIRGQAACGSFFASRNRPARPGLKTSWAASAALDGAGRWYIAGNACGRAAAG